MNIINRYYESMGCAVKGVFSVNVVIYKTRGKNGYLYDMSLNPLVDFEILKGTRKIEYLEVVTPEISVEEAEKILKNIYGISSIVGKIVPSQDYLINNNLRRFKIKRISRIISSGCAIPSNDEISRVEEYIKGKIVSFHRLESLKQRLGIRYDRLIDIIQVLYCERRIKMIPSVRKIKNKCICSFCLREECSDCCLGFKNDDVLLYAADNYNFDIYSEININKKKMGESIKGAYDGVVSFIKSKKDYALLWCAPNAFEYEVLKGGLFEVIKSGGKALFVTSTGLTNEVKENFKRLLEGARVDVTDGITPNFRDLDISICSYSDYPCFYKAFDLVIYDERLAFIDKPLDNMVFICQRAVKERGKFVNIACTPERKKKGILKYSPDIIAIPTNYAKNPIPEPRIVTSRYLKGPEAFIPPMAIDVIKWSLREGSSVIIFVPDDGSFNRMYYYLTSLEGIDRNIIDISEEREKETLLRFKKKEVKILISLDFRDALHVMEDVNVIVMDSDDEKYTIDTLVYMSAIAALNIKNKLGEVVFVASQETEVMSLAKSTIRGINKIAWEKGLIRR